MSRPIIEVILYDLGNVILPFNHYQIAEKLSRFSPKKEFKDPQRIFCYLFDLQKGIINRFDAGEISSREFFQELRKDLGLSVSFNEFVPIWVDIFSENVEVSQIIVSQKERWKLGLLSNTDPLHFDYILSTFPIMRAFDTWILSYEVGFKKPAVEIFQKAIGWASVEPKKILFIDDVEKHVEVATSLGMEGIHFVSADQLKKELSLKLDAQEVP
ncbi:MAG TPA: HAD family phosphatase [Thermodesulfobacteriota bacterium]|nr:HAD family phosphatase [Thermodesulfobacteriota bacterium]